MPEFEEEVGAGGNSVRSRPRVARAIPCARVRSGNSVADASKQSDVVFVSLPSGEVVEEVVCQPGGLLECAIRGQIVIDLGTSPVDLTRRLAAALAAVGATLVDVPVAA